MNCLSTKNISTNYLVTNLNILNMNYKITTVKLYNNSRNKDKLIP